MIKQAVLLCGGKGTRLRPYTDVMSKQMLPVGGHPITEWNIAQFRKHGIREFFINLHTKPDVMRDYFGDGSKWGVNITFNHEPDTPGVAGSVKLFEDMLDDEFFVIYGDMVSLVDYSKMERAWREKPPGALGMQRMHKTDRYADADVAELDDHGRFIAIHPKPHSMTYPHAYRMRGVFIMKKEILSYVPRGIYYEIGRDLLPDIIRRGKAFYSYECDEYSKGFDTEEKWREVEAYLRDHGITYESVANG